MHNLKVKALCGLSVLMIGSTMSLPVLADSFAYTPITGPAASANNAFAFDKDFVMSKDATIPAATFNYAIAPGAEIAPTATTVGVKPGPAGAAIADVVYVTADTDATVTESGTEKTATKQAKVDLSACSFSEPGVYRYIITESGTNNGVTNDAKTKRTLDVYIENGADKTLQVAGYAFYEGEKTDAPSKTAETATGKSEGYTNTYDTYDLTFGKEVKGNFGSLDQYFEFTVTIAADEGTVLQVDISDADATPASNTATTKTTAANPTTLTAGANGITQKFYLHDGQYITIKDLPANATYSVTEDREDYQSANGIVAADNDDSVAHTDPQSGSITADVKTGYTNTRNTVTPTGVAGSLTSMLPGILTIGAGALGAGSIVAVRRKKKK